MLKFCVYLPNMPFSGKQSYLCFSISGLGAPQAIMCTTRWSLTLRGNRAMFQSGSMYGSGKGSDGRITISRIQSER